MNRSNAPWRPLSTAKINWGDDSTPRSERFEDVYYSSQDGMEESSYIFLQGNQLSRRCLEHLHPSFRILETGFGSGLNFLLTWQFWRAQSLPRPRLHFISIEKHPLHKSDLQRALAAWPELASLAEALITKYPEPLAGQHRITFDDGGVTLDLWWEDAEEALLELASFQNTAIDCWYLDGFAPRKNPGMWTDSIYQSMAVMSREKASFASFSSAGHVRRGLEAAGFEVNKLPGYGKKRECIYGSFSGQKNTSTQAKHFATTPWDISASTAASPTSAIVIGAGIAGCTTAASLAKRNIAVQVLECRLVANAGSGNDQGVLYTRLSNRHSPLSDFSLQSFLYASRFYSSLFSSGKLQENFDGALCGSFHQSDKLEEMSLLNELLQSVPGLAQVLSASEANSVLGIEQEKGGYWYPGSGWMRPAAVCQTMLNDNNIKLQENTGGIRLKKISGGWAALAAGRVIAEAECVVVAAGTSCPEIAQLDWLPLQAIRGQTTTLPTTTEFSKLRSALCHKGYISPSREGSHCIGATFDIDDNDMGVRPEDHRKNLNTLAAAVPRWETALSSQNEESIQGRVGYRCASPDYLPLIGPVPNRALFLQNYAVLSKNARRTIAKNGEFIPGLYLSTGHGSRGLTSAPLAAEILASLICNEPLPLSRELYQAVSPGRFLIRQLKRKQV